MKRGILVLFVVLILGLVSASPLLFFKSPTPANNYETTSTSFEINTTLENVSDLSEVIFSWEGSNYSVYDDSLVLMLNFNNNSEIGENDSLVVDSSDNGNNGSVSSASFLSSGKFGGSYSFDADGELINFSDDENFRGSNFTISMWVDFDDFGVGDISADAYSTCVLINSGDVYCVGQNDVGQLGDGTTTDKVIPVKVLGGHNFSSLDFASYPSSKTFCGILQNKSAACWGEGSNGQLGNGASSDSSTPVFVSGGYNFSGVSIGQNHACGVLTNGSALCWGDNSQGEFGNGSSGGSSNVPVFVSGGYNFTSVSAGDESTCGLLINGSGMCWGLGSLGRLGDGESSSNLVPTEVSGNHNFSFISNGNDFACGILQNGSALCWGQNTDGALGDGTETNRNVPTYVSGDYQFSYIESRYRGSCGILQNGSVLCWGWGTGGQLGDGGSSNSLVPVFISGNYNFSLISTGSSHSCGILQNGSSYCWGQDGFSQFGKGMSSASFSIPILFFYGNTSGNSYKDVSFMGTPLVNAGHSCGLLYDGNVTCWGRNEDGALGDNTTDRHSLPLGVHGEYNFSQISSGVENTCGVLTNGSVLCWGDNTKGQIGDNTTTRRLIPTFVSGNYDFEIVSSGASRHTCGLLTNGSALCWGRGNLGQMGNGADLDSSVPVFVSGSYNFSYLGTGNLFSCGLLHNGTALCWGYNSWGSLGDNSPSNSNVPVTVFGGYNFSSLHVGSRLTCGLLTNGSALCWGYNNYGSIGDNTTVDRNIPTPVYGNYTFSNINPGEFHTCGLLTNGSALCWGRNNYGQLADGTFIDKHIPNPISIDENISSFLSSRGDTVFANLTDGRIVSWGDNGNGQQAFSSLDTTVPTKGIFKGNAFGKTTTSFRLGQTFEGNLRAYVGSGFEDVDMDDGWNYVTLSYDGENAKIYKNGNLEKSFTTPLFSWFNDTESLILGEDIRGSVDEVRMWNRTLSASEISDTYNSNLRKVNDSSYEFYSNKSSLSTGTYTYGLYVLDSAGLSGLSLRNIIIKAVTSSSDDSSSSGGSGPGTFRPSRNALENGYSANVIEGTKVEIRFGDVSDEKKEEVEVKSIDSENGEVVLSVGGVDYEVSLDGSSKIDLDGDGFYDVEVLNKNNYGQVSSLEFVLINEEVPSDVQDESGEEVVGSENESGEEIVDSKSKWYFWVIGGIVLIFVVWFILNNIGNKKFRKKFGGKWKSEK